MRGALAKPEWTPYRRANPIETLLSAHMPWLTERAPQVHYSARILF